MNSIGRPRCSTHRAAGFKARRHSHPFALLTFRMSGSFRSALIIFARFLLLNIQLGFPDSYLLLPYQPRHNRSVTGAAFGRLCPLFYMHKFCENINLNCLMSIFRKIGRIFMRDARPASLTLRLPLSLMMWNFILWISFFWVQRDCYVVRCGYRCTVANAFHYHRFEFTVWTL